jgi:hypothetical protein
MKAARPEPSRQNSHPALRVRTFVAGDRHWTDAAALVLLSEDRCTSGREMRVPRTGL